MSDTKKEKLDQDKGDEVLRRLLKTPPDPQKKNGTDKKSYPQKKTKDKGS